MLLGRTSEVASDLTSRGDIRESVKMSKRRHAGVEQLQEIPQRQGGEYGPGREGEDAWCEAVSTIGAKTMKARRRRPDLRGAYVYDRYTWTVRAGRAICINSIKSPPPDASRKPSDSQYFHSPPATHGRPGVGGARLTRRNGRARVLLGAV